MGIEPPHVAKALRKMVYPIYLYTSIDDIGKLPKYTFFSVNNKTKATMLCFSLSAIELYAN